MTAFEDALVKLDTDVDTLLGDTVSYSFAGAPAVSVMGFIGAAPSFDSEDIVDIRRAWQMKIAKSAVPAPSADDRLTTPRLDGTWRPSNWATDENPAYWIIALQKVA